MTDEELTVEPEAQEPQTSDDDTEDEEASFQDKVKDVLIADEEDIGSLRKKLTITIPRSFIDEQREEQFTELRRDAAIPGFRKGRAPVRLVEKRFSTEVGEQLVTQLVSNGYLAAVEKLDLKPLGDPLVWVNVSEQRTDEKGGTRQVTTDKLVAIDEAVEHLKVTDGDFSYSCEVEIKPEFELPATEGVKLTREPMQVKDEDVDAEINYLRRIRGSFQSVGADEPAKEDDVLYVDWTMTVDGDQIDHAEGDMVPVRDFNLRNVPLKGLAESLSGQTAGQQVTVEATVPDDFDSSDLRGKTAKFNFAIKEIKRMAIPELDEAFLISIGFESEDELRQAIRTQMEAQASATVREALRRQMTEYLVGNTEMELPEGLSQRQAERIVARRTMEMYRQNLPEEEIAKAADEMRASAELQSVELLKTEFILDRLAGDLDIEVSEDEFNGAIAAIAARQNRRFDRVRDDLVKNQGLMSLYVHLRDEKVLDHLIDRAEIVEAEEKVESPTKGSSSGKASRKKSTASKKKTKKKKSSKKPKSKE